MASSTGNNPQEPNDNHSQEPNDNRSPEPNDNNSPEPEDNESQEDKAPPSPKFKFKGETVNLLMQLQDLSPEEVARLIPLAVMKDLQNENASRAGSGSAPLAASEMPQPPNDPAPPSPPVPEPSVVIRRSRRHLNGFITFRAYYRKAFAPLTERKISTIMTQLWAHDPFQYRWTIIGRLWSFVSHTLNDPEIFLSDFLHLAAPLMCTPGPETYLNKLGWGSNSNSNYDTVFFQDHTTLLRYIEEDKLKFVPANELELLNHMIVHGYLPGIYNQLLVKIAQYDFGKPAPTGAAAAAAEAS
uniref:Putative mating-type 1-1-1 protein n=1 Tax=Thielaviopsis cerberus TaxID=1580841 RepID=A0A891XKN6_9PEZI|nr:putative mating-type 1-1-1 protein [Thielaviopsis cerberus]